MSTRKFDDQPYNPIAPVLPIVHEPDTPTLRNTPSLGDRKASKNTKGPVLRWAQRLSEGKAWPPGKSLKGFETWMRQSFTEAARIAAIVTKETGIQHDAGHFFGIMVRGGMDAPDALGSQPAWMRSLPGPVQEYLMDKNRTRRFGGRPVQELLDADISVNQLYGFKNYLLHDVDWKGLPPDLKQRLGFTNEPFERILGAAEGSVVDEVNSKSLLTQLDTELKAHDARAVGVAPGEQPGKVTTTKMNSQEAADYAKLSQQAPTGNTLEAFQNVSKGTDLLKIGARLGRTFMPAVGGLGAALSSADAAERVSIANQTGDWLDWVQAGIAGVEATSDTIGTVPSWLTPAVEASGFVSGLSNVGIDVGRHLLSEETAEQKTLRESIPKHGEKPITAEGQKEQFEKVRQHQREEQKAIEAEIKEEAIRRRIYEAGGGNAAMTKYGWTVEQTRLRGQKNLELQHLENMKEYK